MKINIICVGNIKEKFYSHACNEYLKRLSKYHYIEINQVEEEKLPKNYSGADIAKVQVKESFKIEKYCKGFLIICDILGKKFNSVQFAKRLNDISLISSTISIVIGGSFGVSQDLKNKADLLLSFSDYTFPHQLFRVILLEQLYRATTINNNITYHK